MLHAEVFLVTPSETSLVNRRDELVNRPDGHPSKNSTGSTDTNASAHRSTKQYEGRKDYRVQYPRTIHNRPHQKMARLHR